MNSISRATVALALGISALSLAACSKDEPAAEPESQPAPIETTPVAKEETPEDFVRRWFEVSKGMQNTGMTEDYLALASMNCEPCQAVAGDVSALYEAGGWIEFEGHRVSDVDRYKGGQHRYLVKLDSGSTRYTTAKDAPVERLPGGSGRVIVTLEPTGRTWLVADLHDVAN